MTDPIRAAAQALASALPDMADACAGMLDHSTQCFVSAADLRVVLAAVEAALSAPQPAADERVAEHMRLVDEFADAVHLAASDQEGDGGQALALRIEQSARALLAAGREDAEHAAMYRWMKANARSGSIGFGDGWIDAFDRDEWDAWIRAAMQKGTP